ncbi:MAG TPA: hypothetical protein VI455_06505 [Terriglobia bacterium]
MDQPSQTQPTLKQKRDELYAAARENPGSEEAQMVQVLLLAGISQTEPPSYNKTPGLALGVERERYGQARDRRTGERRARHTPEQAQEAGTATEGAESETEELRREVVDREARLRKAAHALEAARSADAEGRPMNPLQVYNRIAEIVGLRSPADETQME